VIAKKPKVTGGTQGTPRWIQIILALVAVGTLALGFLTYLFPKSEALKPNAVIPIAPQTLNLNVSGTDNVGVGNMQGGQINVGDKTTAPIKSDIPLGERKK
jgi:hypothetical protein